MEDGTRDKANHEFISIGLRFVKQGKVFENLIHISHLEGNRLDARSVTEFTLQTLETLDIPANRILSQCYDGASVMSGCSGGLQALLQEELGREVPYLHCFNHCLHLVVVDTILIVSNLSNYFDYCKLLYNFFSATESTCT